LGAALGVLRWHHALVGKSINKGAAISSSILIRLGGLAAMVGGVAWTAVFLLGDLLVSNLSLGFIGKAIQTGSIQGPVMDLLVVAAMAAIVAIAVLYTSQNQRSSRGVVLASLAAFVGLAMYLVGYGVAYVRDDFFLAFPDTLVLVVVGLLVATVGIIALGIIITGAEVLPWWCGVSLAFGSPLLAFLWPLIGVPWIVVGYAIFRAGTRLPERPSRVR
jgi:hypothetical protein